MEEIWKTIKEYPNYKISNTGKILSVKKNKELKIQKDGNGYNFICLNNGNRKKKLKLSRLLAFHFIPNPLNLKTVDHINRIRDDNRLENLRWASYKDQHHNRNYEYAKGELVGNSFWTEEQVKEIKNLYKKGLGKRKIAKLLNCSITQAQSAIDNWNYLDGI
jgi:hypothetical protein